MKEEMDEIIRKLERVQDLLCRGDVSEAKTAAYEAEMMVQFIRDHKC